MPGAPSATGGTPDASSFTPRVTISAWARSTAKGPSCQGARPSTVSTTSTSTTSSPAWASGTSIWRGTTVRSTTPPTITGTAATSVSSSQDELTNSWETGADASTRASSSSIARPVR